MLFISTILKQLNRERKPLIAALFLFGTLVFLRFVVFAPAVYGSSDTSVLPRKYWPETGLAVLMGSSPVTVETGSIRSQDEGLPKIALLSGLGYLAPRVVW